MKRKLFLSALVILIYPTLVTTSASDEFSVPAGSSEIFSVPDENSFSSPETKELPLTDTTKEDTLPVQPTASDVPIDTAHFPSEAFRAYLSRPEQDRNQDGVLQASEIAEIKTVTPDRNSNIDMTGFQYLTSTEELSLQLNSRIVSSSNTVLDLSALTELKTLYVDPDEQPGITLDLTFNSKLKSLSVPCSLADIRLPRECHITSYNAECIYTYIDMGTELYPDHMAILNAMYNIPELKSLTISHFENLDAIDFSRLGNILELTIESYHDSTGEFDSTDINMLDLSCCTNLVALNIDNAFCPKPISEFLNISNCTNLNYLNITNTRLEGAFINLGKASPAHININWPYYEAKIETGGYMSFLKQTDLDLSRICSVENGYISGSRLYINHCNAQDEFYSDHRGQACITYYMNDQKTVTGQFYVFTDELYSPVSVSGLTVTSESSSSLTCKWVQSKDKYDGYALYIQESDTNKTLKKILIKKGVTSQKVSGLKSGQCYTVVIRSYRKSPDGRNYYSPYNFGTVTTFTRPNPPFLKASALSGGKVKFIWTGVPAVYTKGNNQYIIYYRNGSNSSYKRLAVLSNDHGSYIAKGLKKGNTYYFRMRSYIQRSKGETSTFSSYSKTLKIKISG